MYILGVVDPHEVIVVFKETFPKAMEVLKRTIAKIGAKDWTDTLAKVKKTTAEAIMSH